jgi:two-component system sensor histidine kinase KdpD
LRNFFQPDKILQLRELALKEVAGQVERKVEREVEKPMQLRHERFLACISSNHKTAGRIIRKTARLANYYHSDWYVLYVQTPNERWDRIPLDKQRHLLNHFKLAVELGAEVIQAQSSGQGTSALSGLPLKVLNLADANVADAIMTTVRTKSITTVCIGKPHFSLFQLLLRTNVFNKLLSALSANNVDLIILS